MALTALTTTTNPGAQDTASATSLQSSVAANGVSGGTPSTIQPGTSSSALVSTGGIQLTQSSLPGVALGSGTTQTARIMHPQPHKINSAMLGFCVVLFLVAAGLFWFMGRDENNTTLK